MAQPVEIPPDPTAAVQAAEAEVPPALIAQTLGEYARAWIGRMRGGDIGVLPVVVGLVAIMVVFEIISPNHVFLHADNLVNLFEQSAVFMVLAMAETFALILGEIDLSIGYLGACGAVIAVQLVQPVTTNWPWWAAIVAALAACALAGAIQGTIITRLGIPSFIVTLAGYLIFNGVMLILLLLGPFSGYPNLASADTNVQVLYNLMAGTIDPTISWIGMGVVVVGIGGLMWFGDARRRRAGLVAPPPSLTLLKIGLIAAAGIVVVAICNINRANIGVLAGVPWVVPIVLAVLAAWTILLERTKYGRYVYAIGGNPEAARRAGINVSLIVTIAFALCSMTAGIGVILYASYIGGMSNNVQGGQLVLFAVAAAVIGGTSLFGGRGKAMHGVLGGLVIGGIYNGMYLQSLDVQRIFIVTGLVLLAAVSIDALSRRGKVNFPGGRR
ncbi:MAG: ABC transporter permease [Chloroflexi bacterium]|nr:MAG: ABC transporter permease [Chloroflexota bacterium]TMD79076.1 MAG: ABC transporter permease [Chloroflexota bacterium]TMF03252.1 MAG: ABC transporter permease [Chloroflexota bacterium]